MLVSLRENNFPYFNKKYTKNINNIILCFFIIFSIIYPGEFLVNKFLYKDDIKINDMRQIDRRCYEIDVNDAIEDRMFKYVFNFPDKKKYFQLPIDLFMVFNEVTNELSLTNDFLNSIYDKKGNIYLVETSDDTLNYPDDDMMEIEDDIEDLIDLEDNISYHINVDVDFP